MKSLYSKIILGFIVSIVLSFSIASYYGQKRHDESLTELAIERIEKIEEIFFENYPVTNPNVVLSLVKATESTISIIDLQTEMCTIYGEQQSAIELANLQTKMAGLEYMTDEHFVIKKIQVSPSTLVFIHKSIQEEESLFQNVAMLTLGLIFFIGGLIFLIISDVIVKPIQRLTKATNELSNGNYNVNVEYSGNDEIGQLSESFNAMAKRLVKAEENRQKFISDVSHEFQTPLTSIQGFAKILSAEQISDEQRRKYASIIKEQSIRLSTLSKNMMHLTLLDSDDITLEKKRYSITKQFERVVEMQHGYALEKNIEIETDFNKDVLILGDENRMEQVLINILNNAIKYTPENGAVFCRIKKTIRDIEVEIEDTGIGMSEEAKAHIFDRFYREDRSRSIKGNGLGLSIVKRIIDLHGYKLEVESQVDAGSIFRIIIPIEVNLLKNKKSEDA